MAAQLLGGSVQVGLRERAVENVPSAHVDWLEQHVAAGPRGHQPVWLPAAKSPACMGSSREVCTLPPGVCAGSPGTFVWGGADPAGALARSNLSVLRFTLDIYS